MNAMLLVPTEDYKALRERTGEWGVSKWNDDPERTFADVEALLTDLAGFPGDSLVAAPSSSEVS